MASMNMDTNMPVALDAIDSCANSQQQEQENPIATDDDNNDKNSVEDDENHGTHDTTQFTHTLITENNSELSDSKPQQQQQQPHRASINDESSVEHMKSLKELAQLSPTEQQQITISKIDSRNVYNRDNNTSDEDIVNDGNRDDSYRDNKMYIDTDTRTEHSENTPTTPITTATAECNVNVMDRLENANINNTSSSSSSSMQSSSNECMSAVNFQSSTNDNGNNNNPYPSDTQMNVARSNVETAPKTDLEKVSMCDSPMDSAAAHQWKMRLSAGHKCDCAPGKCECSANITPIPDIKENDIDDDIMSEYSNENDSLHTNTMMTNNNNSNNNNNRKYNLKVVFYFVVAFIRFFLSHATY